MAERSVAVVGAGIGGLSCALALAGSGLAVTLFERDAAPSSAAARADETQRRRRGVPHAVHPHFFMGRLREALRARHPELLARLAEAGCEEGPFVDALHPIARARYAPRAGDAALTSIAARRTTFEWVMRRYVEERGLARIESGVEVVGLLGDPETPARVKGVRLQQANGEHADVQADVTVDASGRSSVLARELAALGVQLAEELHDAGIFYFTRHYELLPSRQFPLSHGLPGFLFADFAVGALPADSGAFTVTYQVQRDDPELIALVRDPERFHALCLEIPALARWLDPQQARPTSDVFGFGHMDTFWRSTLAAGAPQVLGFFLVGDAAVRTNPRYGRGCTWSFVSAALLAETFDATQDPRERALRYDRALERELRADWRTMLAMDRASRARFEIAAGRRKASLRDAAVEAFTGLLEEAQLTDAEVFRAIWSGYHGFQGMTAWMRDPRVWRGLGRHALLRRRHRPALAERARRPSRAQILHATRAATP